MAASGNKRKEPAEQLVFHDGPETTYRYVELSHWRARIVRCESTAKNLIVPERIGGFLVTELGEGAFAGLAHVQDITCPVAVERIGAAAFSECSQLRRIVFPSAMATSDPTWLLGCTQLEDVALPAKATRFDEDFLASFTPRRVFVGAKTRRFAVPERWFDTLREFAIDADNPWIATDGTCIYSRDGRKLLACAVHRPVIDVASGCREIARKAFAGNIELRSINLPEGLQVIGTSAFAESGLIGFSACETLREIAARAFARCAKLQQVDLNEGLQSIGEEAFAHCRALERMNVPASLRDLGARATFDTLLQERGETQVQGSASREKGLSAPDRVIFADDQGVLYKRISGSVPRANEGVPRAGGSAPGASEGLAGCDEGTQGRDASGRDDVLVLLDAGALRTAEYEALPGTREVAARAFYRNQIVQSVGFPDGLRSIGRFAFAECPRLSSVRLPDSLRSIGERAFCGSPLRAFSVPVSLDYMGERALGIVESGRAEERPALRACSVSSGNEHFFMHDGLLCEYAEAGVRVVLYVGPETDVSLPTNTCEVAPFAFAGARDIKRLYIPGSVLHVGIAAFAVAEPCDVVEFQRARRWRGQDSVVVRPPRDANGAFAMRGVLAHPPLSARSFSEACDQAVLASRSRLVRARYMVQRLEHPLYLERGMRKRYESELSEQIVSVCQAFFKADERKSLAALGDLGFLPDEVLTRVLDAAQDWGNVACTALLLNMKHESFGHVNDFDL